MKCVVCLAVLLVVISLSELASTSEVKASEAIDRQEADAAWDDYKKTHKKKYHSDKNHRNSEAKRRKHFDANHAYITKHNNDRKAGKHKKTFSLGHNEYSDLSQEEFQAMNGAIPPLDDAAIAPSVTNRHGKARTDLPASIDWVAKGAVTPVKDQQSCGSCWTFSSTGSIEGQHFRATGKLVSLSEQQLVDCVYLDRDGCSGGWMQTAYDSITQLGGIDTGTAYPYMANVSTCKYTPDTVGATVVGYVRIAPLDEQSMKEVLATVGPISVVVNAAGLSIRFYKDGIYNDPDCNTTQNHAVLLVGYGTSEQGQDYWTVKNSWGTSFGVKGYLNITRNVNQCGVALNAMYPLVTEKYDNHCVISRAYYPYTSCIFPFTYGGKTYNECAFSIADKAPFCATKLEDNGTFIYSPQTRGVCSSSCPGGSSKLSDFAVSASTELIPGGIWASAPSDSCSYLTMQTDGNLVLYRKSDKKVLWASFTKLKGKKSVFQPDGNLVVLDATGNRVWTSNVTMKATGGAMLVVQDDGNMVIYDANLSPLWSSGTQKSC